MTGVSPKGRPSLHLTFLIQLGRLTLGETTIRFFLVRILNKLDYQWQFFIFIWIDDQRVFNPLLSLKTR
jgi:hypothetical protein